MGRVKMGWENQKLFHCWQQSPLPPSFCWAVIIQTVCKVNVVVDGLNEYGPSGIGLGETYPSEKLFHWWHLLHIAQLRVTQGIVEWKFACIVHAILVNVGWVLDLIEFPPDRFWSLVFVGIAVGLWVWVLAFSGLMAVSVSYWVQVSSIFVNTECHNMGL